MASKIVLSAWNHKNVSSFSMRSKDMSVAFGIVAEPQALYTYYLIPISMRCSLQIHELFVNLVLFLAHLMARSRSECNDPVVGGIDRLWSHLKFASPP